ncbi:MAG: hypothetical protein JWO14_3916 [Solirubrobacterales bacterium]|nr:hypothetical protein [Solirubrobacterales bacterium]
MNRRQLRWDCYLTDQNQRAENGTRRAGWIRTRYDKFTLASGMAIANIENSLLLDRRDVRFEGHVLRCR